MNHTEKKETLDTGAEIQAHGSEVCAPRWISDRERPIGSAKGVSREILAATLEEMLCSDAIPDYCPNGLQVEGAAQVVRIVCGVTASLALLRAAVAAQAQALLVHHGWFWRGEDPRILGARRDRLAMALGHGLNLFAYHLPLDRHPEWGNNIQLARHLGWPEGRACGRDGLLRCADWAEPTSAAVLAEQVRQGLRRTPWVVGALDRSVRRVVWCTGAAQDALQEAIDLGADLFMSGEISERTTHLAREAGVVYMAAGHHATERYGVQAVGAALARRLPIEVLWIEDPNPV